MEWNSLKDLKSLKNLKNGMEWKGRNGLYKQMVSVWTTKVTISLQYGYSQQKYDMLCHDNVYVFMYMMISHLWW